VDRGVGCRHRGCVLVDAGRRCRRECVIPQVARDIAACDREVVTAFYEGVANDMVLSFVARRTAYAG
jgi:hypothetical protein